MNYKVLKRLISLCFRSGTLGAEGIDNIAGNSGIPGRWIMRIDNSNGEEDGDFKCLEWFTVQPNPTSYTALPDPCPCTVDQAELDDRYQWVEPIIPYTECFYTIRGSRQGLGRKCCYYKDAQRLGALIIGDIPKGGTIDRYHKFTSPDDHESSDILGFQYCCFRAENFREMCELYYRKRPSEGCDAYDPPVQGKAWTFFLFFVSM